MTEHVYGDDHQPDVSILRNDDSGMWNVKVNGAHIGSTVSEEDGEVLADWWIEQIYQRKGGSSCTNS